MRKKEIVVQAHEMAARAIDEFVKDGRTYYFAALEDVPDLERQLLAISGRLAIKAAKLEGDDGQD